ncbi:helix-turn-helix transcriptional regulator [Roseburia hominis]|uniref:helix-turn-helix domain-containing protein n=1 Tax=Roseburia hominis TaxID=301301 RepID=UPI0020180BF7|nr:helix-turn-helix transcriptional regulator [Roseburia hominis]MCL3783353.1 helix-turn-helix transcriptional regulator [Roseburia hominis]
MTIGEQIKKIRQEKGLSQKKLGEILGVSQQMIGQYENPYSNLKLDTIKKIADALNIDYTELVQSNLLDVADYSSDLDSSDLEYIREFVASDLVPYPEHEKAELLHLIDTYIFNGNAESKPAEYYQKLEIELSNKILDDLLIPYKNTNVIDLTELVSYFLKLNEHAKNKVLDYEDDLYQVKRYRSK